MTEFGSERSLTGMSSRGLRIIIWARRRGSILGTRVAITTRSTRTLSHGTIRLILVIILRLLLKMLVRILLNKMRISFIISLLLMHLCIKGYRSS